ncbi:MAG: DUF2252 family protein [Nostoc sp.]|uniref:DUF2252 family protein n=1 Tax=Nostoc sp. TaxID=1180 RepID=UPI002FF57159
MYTNNKVFFKLAHKYKYLKLASWVTIATKAMLSNLDPLVGYTTVSSIPFMVREKSPYQVDFDYKFLTSKSKFMNVMGYTGKVVAKNHAISDRDYDAAIIPISVGKEVTDIVSGNKAVFKDEIFNFAVDYATQVEFQECLGLE